MRQYEEILGVRHPGITTLSKRAESLLDSLESKQRQQVTAQHAAKHANIILRRPEHMYMQQNKAELCNLINVGLHANIGVHEQE